MEVCAVLKMVCLQRSQTRTQKNSRPTAINRWLQGNTRPSQTLQKLNGFTLIEAMVAMLVAAIFVSITMQALVTAAAFRSRATQYDEAVSWIQEDLEGVLEQAKLYEMNAYPYSSRCGSLIASDGLAAGFMNDRLGSDIATLGSKSFGGETFKLTRVADYTASSDPFGLLQVTYYVEPEDGGEVVATVSTEIVPHAVLNCP